MTLRAAIPVTMDVSDDGVSVPLRNAGDVDELIKLMTREGSPGVADIQGAEEDPVITVQVHSGYGYLAYYSDDASVYSLGDPDSPELREESEEGYPAGAGLSLDQLRAALAEVVTTGQAPTVVPTRNLKEWEDELRERVHRVEGA